MADLLVPALLDAFNLESELDVAKSRAPVLSAGRWTDTSNTDPGIVAVRLMLENIERWVYSIGARYVSEDIVLHLGSSLLKVPLAEPSKAGGRCEFNVAPNTTIQAGFQVGDEQRGVVYEVKVEATSTSGGVIELEVEAIQAGAFGNTDFENPTSITGLRSAATVGQVHGVINTTRMDGGSDGDTLETYSQRLPAQIQNDTIIRPPDFERRALSDTRVGRARCYPATRPDSVVGRFVAAADHVTIIVAGAAGGVPAPSVITDVVADIAADTLFNLFDPDAAKTALHVLPVRLRPVLVTAILEIKTTAKSLDVIALAKANLVKFLNPITGGDEGLGFALGEEPGLYELGAVLEATTGVRRVKSGSLVLSGVGSMGIDELVSVSANDISLTTVYL